MGLMDIIGELAGTANSEKKENGFDLGTIMSVANTLLDGDEENTGSQSGQVNTSVLTQILGGLDGDSQPQLTTSEQQVSGGVLSTILSALGNGDEQTTGAADGLVNPQTLMTVLAMFTGNSNNSSSSGTGINIGQLVSYLLPLLTNSQNLHSSFTSDPGQMIQQLIGVQLSAEELAPVVSAVNKQAGTKARVPSAGTGSAAKKKTSTAPKAPKKPAAKPAARKTPVK